MSGLCPCGIARVDCEYHRTGEKTEHVRDTSDHTADAVAYSLAVRDPLSPRAQHVLTRLAGLRLIGADDHEVSTDVIYKTPDGRLLSVPLGWTLPED